MSEQKKKSDAAKAGSSFIGMFKRLFVHEKLDVDVLAEEAMQTPAMTIFKNLIHNRIAVIGFIVFAAVLLFSFAGSQIKPLPANYIELTNANLPPSRSYLKYPKELESKNIVKAVAGVSYGAAITDDGQFYIWGSECNQKLAGVSDYIMDVPAGVYENRIVNIESGGKSMFAIDEDNNVYSGGYYGSGQTELSDEVLKALEADDVSIQDLVAATQWSGALTTDGHLFVWGSTQARMLFVIPGSIQGHIVDMAAGDNNIALLLDDGTIKIIGDRGTEFALGIPEELTDGSVQVTHLAATNRNVVATDSEGRLYLWGSAENGLNIMPEFEGDVVDVVAGYKNFAILLENGEIVVWGADQLNQLKIPAKVRGAKKLYAGYFQFYAVGEQNQMLGAWGNKGYVFGTDQYGRDMLTRLIHGGRISLTVGAIAVVISTFIAIIVGLVSGYFGGWVDHLLMRVTDIFMAIPFYPIAVTLSYVIGNSLSESARMYLIMVIMGLLSWMGLAQLIRAQLLLEREKDFVLAARALGVRQRAIMARHILPNVFNLIIVNITLGYAGSLLSEAGLSFLNFGVMEPTPSWGNMLTSAQDSAVIQYYWWRWIIPGIFVILAALSINMVGDALREAMDPRSNER